MDMEQIVFGLIVNSGEAKSLAFEALEHAKAGDFKKAREIQKKADEKSLEAHRIQTELLHKEAQGEANLVSILLVHAQDHLMGSMLAKELLSELIYLYEKIEKVEKMNSNSVDGVIE